MARAPTPLAAGSVSLHSSAWKVPTSSRLETKTLRVMNGHRDLPPAPTSTIVATHRATLAPSTWGARGVDLSIDAWMTPTPTSSIVKARSDLGKSAPIPSRQSRTWRAISSFGETPKSAVAFYTCPALAT